MNQWQELRPQNAIYISHNIPCEFLVAFKKHMQVFLKDQLKPFNIGMPYLSVVGDKATDLGGRTTLLVCLRYLDHNGEPKEIFISFQEL